MCVFKDRTEEAGERECDHVKLYIRINEETFLHQPTDLYMIYTSMNKSTWQTFTSSTTLFSHKPNTICGSSRRVGEEGRRGGNDNTITEETYC